jgi:hypothetical protein
LPEQSTSRRTSPSAGAFGIGEDALEVAVAGEVGEARHRELVPEQRLSGS